MTDVTDHYPSTGDLPPIAGGQDPVLAILTNARKRYKRGGTRTAYLYYGGQVCAVGAVAAAAGLKARDYLDPDNGISFSGAGSGANVLTGPLKAVNIEDETIKAAKKAITLLNASARRLYPETKTGSWSGPLEALNQGRLSYQKAVLKCYDDAIERRSAKKLVAA